MSDDLLATADGDDNVELNEAEVAKLLDSPEHDEKAENVAPTPKESGGVKNELISADENDEDDHHGEEDDLFDAAIDPTMNEFAEHKPPPAKKRALDNGAVHPGITSGPVRSLVNGVIRDDKKVVHSPSTSSTTSTSTRNKFCAYVSQMTWWTTDADLQAAMEACGINDVIDIRFFENRQNGQSKGFALVVVGSEASNKLLFDRLPTKFIHGQAVQVLSYSKTNLQKLEDAARRSDPRLRSQTESSTSNPSIAPQSMGTIRLDGSGAQPSASTSGQAIPLNSILRASFLPPPGVQPPNQFSQPPPPIRATPLMAAQTAPPPGLFATPPPALPNPQAQSSLFQQVLGPPPSVTGPMPLMSNGMGMGLGMSGAMQQGFTMNLSQPPPNFSMPPPSAPRFTHPPPMMAMQQANIEEIMERNRTVCNSAINRATSDATRGDYAGARETVMTAMTLIQQSGAVDDDRCRRLLGQLDETLRAIEAKRYSRSSRHSRRSRSRSPDRRSRHRSRRSRSRSHERDRGRYSPRRRY